MLDLLTLARKKNSCSLQSPALTLTFKQILIIRILPFQLSLTQLSYSFLLESVVLFHANLIMYLPVFNIQILKFSLVFPMLATEKKILAPNLH